MDIANGVAIVTGASRGLGTYIAAALAKKGAKLALAARTEEDLKQTAKELERYGTETITVTTDVTKRSDLQRLVRRTIDELGPPDVLVNNAGIEYYAHFHRMELDGIEAIIKANVISLEWLTRLVIPSMIERRRGHVVNMASMAGKTAMPYNTVYSSSKHAVVGFTWSLREELRPYGVGVSAVCPTFVSEAGMYTEWSSEDPPSIVSLVSPDDVAAATIRAIEKNRAEILVTKGLSRVVDVVHAISPELTTATARRSGVYGYLSKAATDYEKRKQHKGTN